ncbi:MAG: hypothetical protein SFW08_06945 [Gemmatimonadaceae bacterium]|nr:hypothetical protein [Gemmatimonadaceae bacterium]
MVLSTAEWQARAATHFARIQPYTAPRRARRARGESHPVHDFLFTYYHYSAGRLESWHPAPGEAIEDSEVARARFRAPAYSVVGGAIVRRPGDIPAGKRDALVRTRALLAATRDRPAHFGCYGLHEWAMVYGGHEIRHAGVAPLRLPQAEIDALVDSRPIACSHFDAFRFFAPAAKPRNRLPIVWETRDSLEQPGCIHANMDLYRWAFTGMPWVGSDLLADCFALAMELRDLDMQAGPYDLRAFGVAPLCIETPEGRDEYARRQRELSQRASGLRAQLIEAIDRSLAD